MLNDRELLRESRAWPVVEAVRLLDRVERAPPEKGFVLFQTGYGPSGLPHIGTFAEVFRTSLVRQAFARLSDLPTRLFAFSDDMDGLRAVPDNIPHPALVAQHLQKPLTSIPDPFGTAESYGHNMNQRLKSFLDGFGFEYEFVSATECYRAGRFNEVLRRVLERHEAIRVAVLPTLGAERQETYSPILPICPDSGRVLQVAILRADAAAGTVTYRDPAGRLVEQSILSGQGKLQWRADWAMRWTALGVDYEMSGKDLIDSVKISSRICRILGGTPPEGFSYELFLDEHGHKISKSKGNGLTVEEWLRYGTKDSLKLFMYQAPRKAKRLYFDVIPRTVDEYLGLLDRYPQQDPEQRYANPVWHMHDGAPPSGGLPITYGMLLNLASVVNAEEPAVLWSFIRRYAPPRQRREHAGARPAGRPRARLLPGLRQAEQGVQDGERERAGGPRRARGLARPVHAGDRFGRRCRAHPDRGLRDRQASRLRRRPARLVQGAVRDPARPERGPALRLVRGVLRAGGDHRADPPGAARRAARPVGRLSPRPWPAR